MTLHGRHYQLLSERFNISAVKSQRRTKQISHHKAVRSDVEVTLCFFY